MDLSLIISLSVFLLIVIILLIYRRNIHLGVARMLHGKYSYDYIRVFKKYTNKSPFPYCIKDEIMSYLHLTEKKRNMTDHFFTLKEPLFENLPFHTPVVNIRKKHGEPECFNSYIIKGFELNALGYFKDDLGTSVKVIFYIFLNELVMGEYIITPTKKNDTRQIASAIMNRAGVESQLYPDRFFIDYQDKSSIYFYETGFSVIVRYIDWTNKIFMELIK